MSKTIVLQDLKEALDKRVVPDILERAKALIAEKLEVAPGLAEAMLATVDVLLGKIKAEDARKAAEEILKTLAVHPSLQEEWRIETLAKYVDFAEEDGRANVEDAQSQIRLYADRLRWVQAEAVKEKSECGPESQDIRLRFLRYVEQKLSIAERNERTIGVTDMEIDLFFKRVDRPGLSAFCLTRLEEPSGGPR